MLQVRHAMRSEHAPKTQQSRRGVLCPSADSMTVVYARCRLRMIAVANDPYPSLRTARIVNPIGFPSGVVKSAHRGPSGRELGLPRRRFSRAPHKPRGGRGVTSPDVTQPVTMVDGGIRRRFGPGQGGLTQDWPRTGAARCKGAQRTSWVEQAPKDGLHHPNRWNESPWRL